MSVNLINTTCKTIYGAGICDVNPTTALWLAERILKDSGKNVFKTISRHREKFGKGTTYPEFGSALFASM